MTAPANILFAPHRFVSENVFLTKYGQLGVVYRLDGIDYECLADETLESYSQRLAAAFRLLDEDFRIYQYLVKHEGADLGGEAAHPNPVVSDTLDRRREFLATKEQRLYTISLYLVVLYEPEVVKTRWRTQLSMRIEAQRVREHTEYLMTRAASFRRTINDLLGLTLLDKAAAFRFFRLLANLDSAAAEAEHVRYDNHLDHWMAGSVIGCTPEEISVDLSHVRVLALREEPRATFPNVLRDFLKLEANFILCSEFKREANEKSIAAINAAQGHFKVISTLKSAAAIAAIAISKIFGSSEREAKADIVPDASSLENIERLKQIVVRLNNEGEYMGHYSLTLVLHSPDRSKVQGAAADAMKIIGNHEGSLVRETYNALNAYRAIIPGNQGNNFRQMWMLSRNYIDLAMVYAPRVGDKRNQHLNAPHLLTLETTDGTPYAFNLHEADLLGVLEFGVMGAGKSFFNNAIIDHLQQYDPLTFVLDIGGSYQFTARKHKGGHLKLADHYQEFSFNPFAMERDMNTNEFLSSFVHVLLELGGYHPTPQDNRIIDRATEKAGRLSDLDIPEHLKEQLYNWTGEGRFAYLFDNPRDTFDMASFQAIDFQGVTDKVLTPLFFYIFHRISRVVYSPQMRPRLKFLLADEIVWKFMRLRVARDFFIEAGKTWRKHNGGIMLTTQSPLDLVRDELLDALKEICPTWVFLANPGGHPDFYRTNFGMNERQIAALFSVIPKKQIYLMRTAAPGSPSRVLNVNMDPLSSWYYRNDPQSNAERDAAIAAHGFEEGLKILAAKG